MPPLLFDETAMMLTFHPNLLCRVSLVRCGFIRDWPSDGQELINHLVQHRFGQRSHLLVDHFTFGDKVTDCPKSYNSDEVFRTR